MMINCIIATRLFSSSTIFFAVHASNQGQKGPNAGEFDLRNLTEIEEEDPDLLDMDEDEDDNQLILSEEMFDPAYKADTFPLKPRHNRSKYFIQCVFTASNQIPFVLRGHDGRSEISNDHVPVGPAVIAVGKNIVKTGQSIYIRVPSKTVTDQANNAFGTIHNEFDLGSQPRADLNRPLRQQALAWAKLSSSSHPEELTQELPVRIWEGVRLPQIPPKREPSQKLKESARRPENTRSPYALNIHANIAESTLPTVIAAVRLTGIDGEIQDPEEIFNAVEMIWDTRAHGTIVSEDT